MKTTVPCIYNFRYLVVMGELIRKSSKLNSEAEVNTCSLLAVLPVKSRFGDRAELYIPVEDECIMIIRCVSGFGYVVKYRTFKCGPESIE